jgi:hypothetical protein
MRRPQRHENPAAYASDIMATYSSVTKGNRSSLGYTQVWKIKIGHGFLSVVWPCVLSTTVGNTTNTCTPFQLTVYNLAQTPLPDTSTSRFSLFRGSIWFIRRPAWRVHSRCPCCLCLARQCDEQGNRNVVIPAVPRDFQLPVESLSCNLILCTKCPCLTTFPCSHCPWLRWIFLRVIVRSLGHWSDLESLFHRLPAFNPFDCDGIYSRSLWSYSV